TVRVTRSRSGFPAYISVSQFLVKADRSKLGGELYCRSTMSWSIATLYRTFYASISFGLSSYWLEGGIENVTLTSPNCGAIGHSCELVQNDLTVLSKLNRTSVTTISTSIRSYSATVKIVCVGLQMKNGDKIFQVTAIKTIGGEQNAHNAIINHMEAGKENSSSQSTPTTCDTLRLVLFTTVVCGLLSVASVIGCATIMLRRAATVAAKKVSTAKALGGCRGCHCSADTVRAGPRNPALAAAVPPSLRASLKTCTYYEDLDEYSQIGSCLKSPYVNYS
uniref:Glycoprotein n=1 Tax=Macrostomum lignano TaxID=282301 RepID=A0A1I8I1M6_9PLAT